MTNAEKRRRIFNQLESAFWSKCAREDYQDMLDASNSLEADLYKYAAMDSQTVAAMFSEYAMRVL